MLEGTWNRLDHVVARGIKENEKVIFVNPGFRWSYDLPSGLRLCRRRIYLWPGAESWRPGNLPVRQF
jgi:hypothetical protein